MKNIFLNCFTLYISFLAFGQQSIYDKKFESWANDFNANKLIELKTTLDQEISQTERHPLSLYSWYVIRKSLNESEVGLSPFLKNYLAFQSHVEEDANYELVNKYDWGIIKQYDLYSQVEWIYALAKFKSPEEVISHFISVYQQNGENFRLVWTLYNLKKNNERYHDVIHAQIDKGLIVISEEGKALLKEKQQGNLDNLKLIQTYAKSHPKDPLSHRYEAITWASQNYYEKAGHCYKSAYELDPFFALGANRKDYILTSKKANSSYDLNSEAAVYGKLYKNKSTEIQGYLLPVIFQYEAGNLGICYEILKQIDSTYFKTPEYLYESARIAYKTMRYELAEELFRKLDLKGQLSAEGKKQFGYSMLENKNYRDLQDYLNNNKSVLKFRDYYYYLLAAYYEANNKNDLYLATYLQGLNVFPQSQWLRKNASYGAQRELQKDLSDSLLLTLIEETPNDFWTNNRFAENLKINAPSLAEAGKEYQRFLEQNIHSRNAWKARLKFCKTTEEKLTIWEEAIIKNPGKLFPFDEIQTMLIDLKDYELLEQYDKRAEQEVMLSGSLDDKVELELYLAVSKVYKLLSVGISSEENRIARIHLEKFKENNGKLGEYYRRIAPLLDNAELNDDAKETAYLACKIDPDSDFNMTKLIQVYPHSKRFEVLYDYLMRNPFNKDKLYKFCHSHAYWNGSPIATLWAMQEFGYENKSIKEKAYHQLGTSEEYINYSSIANSVRYIQWYNIDRERMWKPQPEIIIDYKSGTAQILYSDGTYAERQDNVKLGKIQRIQVGDSYIAATYNYGGEITSINSSNGKGVSLKYNEKGKINELLSNDGTTLLFEYNEAGKPIKIELKGQGSLTIAYDENNEILSIESTDGRNVSLNINRTVTEMMTMINALSKSSSLANGTLPDLGFDDEKLAELENDLIDVSPNSKNWIKLNLALSRYLSSSTSSNAVYGPRSLEILAELKEPMLSSKNKKERQQFVELAKLYHSTLQKVRKRGVAFDYWNSWVEIQDELEIEKQQQKSLNKYRLAIEEAQKTFNAEPIILLKNTEWLPKSKINNIGYWRVADLNTIFTEADATVNTTFVRANGDVIIGSNKGIATMTKGYWERFRYNGSDRTFVKHNETETFEELNFNCFSESKNGDLYIGTSDGLFITREIAGEIDKTYKYFSELNSKAIIQIVQFYDKMVIATNDGIAILSNDNQVLNSISFDKSEVYQVVSSFLGILISTNNGIFLLERNSLIPFKVFDQARKKIELLVDSKETTGINLLAISGDEVRKLIFNFELKKYIELPVYDNILTTQAKISHKIKLLPVNDGELKSAVLTDLGISFYNDNHFEHFHLTNLPERIGIKDASYQMEDNIQKIALLTSQQIAIFEQDNISITAGKVSDIIVDDSLGLTFVAKKGLFYIKQQDPNKKLNQFDWADVDAMALDNQHRLIANDGSKINRYTIKSDDNILTETLFYSYPSADGGFDRQGVQDITTDASGNIWVTTKLSIFRYHDTLKVPVEFNFFQDQEKFPSYTHWNYKILELPNNEIVAITSNEGHLDYKGIKMSGGLIWYNRKTDAFEKDHYKDDPAFNPPSWFMSSITKVSDQKSILGSVRGFGEINNGIFQTYGTSTGNINNKSYSDLKNKYKSLLLGTQGIQIGDFWLFGSGAGIVGYSNGQWFYPDRINKMLPDDLEFGQYGSRHVNDLAIDQFGKIYVGTDRGLLVYETGGKNPVSFLMSDFNKNYAFAYNNQQMIEAEARQIISAFDASTKTGSIVLEIQQAEQKMETLKVIRNAAEFAETDERMMHKMASSDSIAKELKIISNRHAELLVKLESENPGIYQALRVDPIDLMSQRAKMKDNEVVLQYIPSENNLNIQFVSKERLLLTTVAVDKTFLINLVEKTKLKLQNSANTRGAMVDDLVEDDDSLALKSLLHELYKYLIAPIEKELTSNQIIYVIPNGELSNIPFAALIKDLETEKYLVEEYNFGYLSSLYLYQLIFDVEKKNNGSFALFGDPDGSLPGARKEVEDIGAMVHTETYCGSKASTTNFIKKIDKARYVHIASHGYLDDKNLKDSWLLFSDKKLKLTEAFDLPLSESELVVLSACETSSGSSGMEYATLARSFCNAGAETVVATLWQVNDKASQQLMTYFYEELTKGLNRFAALANAQRRLLKSEYNDPGKWAAYIPIGKP